MRQAAITYEGLPLSNGGAHRLRTRGFAEGHAALASFVDRVAVVCDPEQLLAEVVVAATSAPQPALGDVMAQLDARYAKRRVRTIGDYRGSQWAAPSADLAEIVEQFEQAGPFPRAGHAGPSVVIHATWRLTLIDPTTRAPLPHQDPRDYLGFEIDADRRLGASRLYARIARSTTAHVFLSLPFETPSAEARRLAAHIQTAFPARLSSRHWKHWRLTKAGDRYVGRRTQALV